MAYTSSLHLSKHLLLPKGHRARPSSSRSPSFVRAARVNGAPHVNGQASKAPNGKVQINGGDGKKGGAVNGHGKKVPGVLNGKTHHVNGHDRIHLSVSTGPGGQDHLSVSTGPGGQDGTGLRVAYQGAPGAYSEFAAKTALPGCETVPCRSFVDALAAVDRGLVDRAILPVESTMEGTALRNYDLLLRHDLVVAQEINLFVHYCLLAMPGVRATEVRRVISHPMALAHCGRALARLGVDREPVEDTAGAVEMLRSNMMLDTAAIASPRAADLYGLDVLAHGLQDESWNVTRFLLLSRPPSPVALPVDADAKTSIVVAHRGGSMAVVLKVLSAFSSRGINMSKLEIINNEGGGVDELRGCGPSSPPTDGSSSSASPPSSAPRSRRSLFPASIFSAQNGGAVFYRSAKLLVVLCVISGIFSGVRSCCFGIANMILVKKRMREMLFDSILSQDIAFFDEETVGDLTSRRGSDCQQVSRVIGNDLNLISRNLLQRMYGFPCFASSL